MSTHKPPRRRATPRTASPAVARAPARRDDGVTPAPGTPRAAAALDALGALLARAVQERTVPAAAPGSPALLQRWPGKKKNQGPTITHHVKSVMGQQQPSAPMVSYRGSTVRIQHSEQDRGFLLKIAAMLERIEAALGTGLIDGITATGEKVTIVRGALNYCRGGGTAGSTKLRSAHSGYENRKFADELDDAMQSAGVDVDDLATAVAACKLPHWNNTRSASPFTSAHAARPLLTSWLAATHIPAQDQTGHAMVDVLSLVLADHLTHGSGVSSSISFDADLTNAGGGAGVRPPEVGLAHELTHAYYHARGMQLGTEDSSSELSGGRLFELQAVGLKPFHLMPYSENRMRAALGGGLPLRTNYP